MTQVGDLTSLNELYAVSEDPWHSRSGWNQSRKRSMVLGALPRARYNRTVEIGCDVAELTSELARRSDFVLGADPRREAIETARQRTGHLSNVEIQPFRAPDQWPSVLAFDLVVLHEIGYLSEAATWAQLCHAVTASLAPDATVLACHWRHEVEGRLLQTETVHGMLDSILGLAKQTHIVDADFVIDVWTNTERAATGPQGLR